MCGMRGGGGGAVEMARPWLDRPVYVKPQVGRGRPNLRKLDAGPASITLLLTQSSSLWCESAHPTWLSIAETCICVD